MIINLSNSSNISFIRMAAIDTPQDASIKTLSIKLISSLVRATCEKYTWNKRDSTFKTFLKRLTQFAACEGITLEELAASSLIHTMNVDYSSIAKFDWLPELNERFQNIPYIIHVGEDNITNVVVCQGNVDCPIKTITPEMMHMLRYLGIVRVFVKSDLIIPCWTDNIVHLEIKKICVMSNLDANRIPFPKYLQGMIDKSTFEGSYTNWLPPTLITLVSACIELRNLSPNLKNYTYTGVSVNSVLAEAEYLPIGLEKATYSNIVNQLTTSEITMPPGTQYLEVGLDRIPLPHRRLIIKNVKTLNIISFTLDFSGTDIETTDIIPPSNLALQYDSECCFGCNLYRQDVEIILEEGLIHLIINLKMGGFLRSHSIGLLECITQIPASLKEITILVHSIKREPVHLKKILLSKDTSHFQDFMIQLSPDNDCKQLTKQSTIIQDFIQRFSHIKVYIELLSG